MEQVSLQVNGIRRKAQVEDQVTQLNNSLDIHGREMGVEAQVVEQALQHCVC